uniref:Uncharacterized protein n=1 Tax=Chromera velia CCMP2878 TaxID=1169474 RepID=A0A0G4I1G2_9ALVE|eukprot:Cvel_10122.t1-p1 / transcript=Cvel_10122.t1 / gene=Cvel_10122 / organism=Chromera_velia_CCMP2878 / gene_product=hypothetical protein / transcript_product=hypothetical protein / location=Cvel_scaffold603:53461-54974(+) / protein_length=375 / sequence_SO=supercontig / SO=protein_coding / is_pseudo=false
MATVEELMRGAGLGPKPKASAKKKIQMGGRSPRASVSPAPGATRPKSKPSSPPAGQIMTIEEMMRAAGVDPTKKRNSGAFPKGFKFQVEELIEEEIKAVEKEMEEVLKATDIVEEEEEKNESGDADEGTGIERLPRSGTQFMSVEQLMARIAQPGTSDSLDNKSVAELELEPMDEPTNEESNKEGEEGEGEGNEDAASSKSPPMSRVQTFWRSETKKGRSTFLVSLGKGRVVSVVPHFDDEEDEDDDDDDDFDAVKEEEQVPVEEEKEDTKEEKKVEKEQEKKEEKEGETDVPPARMERQSSDPTGSPPLRAKAEKQAAALGVSTRPKRLSDAVGLCPTTPEAQALFLNPQALSKSQASAVQSLRQIASSRRSIC